MEAVFSVMRASQSERTLGDHDQTQMRSPLATDAGCDFGAKQPADGVEAGLDVWQVCVVRSDEGHEQRAAARFGVDVEDPHALEVGIGQVAGEHEVDALVGLSAQLRELSIDAAGLLLRV
jgi:hypothetical protein